MGWLRGAALTGAALCFLAGCSLVDAIGGSRERVLGWAAAHGFRAERIAAGQFVLLGLLRQRAADDTLTIYIEGDGAPWPSPYHPPSDPTPRDPLALRLADRDTAPQLAYLGRPCQYQDDPERAGCDAAWWTSRRYVPAVLAAMDAAVSHLKHAAGAKRLHLVGHSGGGVVATLLAFRRRDVDRLVTVAAPLSLAGWVAHHRLSPLADALDPLKLAERPWLPLAVHFAGADDEVVPAALVAEFTARHGGQLVTIAGFDHDCCWAREWPELLRRARRQPEESP